MAAALIRTQVGMTKTTTDIAVEENNISKLMYYVNCIATVLRLDDPEISRLRNYKQYRSLSEEERQKLIIFCILMDPDILNDRVIFQEDSMVDVYQNEFYDLSVASTTLAVSESIVIGGTRRQVRKIMCYTKSWLKENYTDPLEQLTAEHRRQTALQTSRQPTQSGPSRPRTASAQTSAPQAPQRRPQSSRDPEEKKSDDCVIL